MLLAVGLAYPATATAQPEQRGLKEPFSSARQRSASGGLDDTPWVEQCDGSRAPASSSESLQCRQWRVEWHQDGKLWGAITAPTQAGVISLRDRALSFVRDDARLFDQAIDRRFATPGPPICDVCRASDPAGASGMFGDGQRFAGSDVRKAVVATAPKVDALQKALFEQHVPRMREVARHAHDTKTAKAAKQYVKALRTALFDLVRARLWLENAVVLHSKSLVDQTNKLVGGRTDALAKDFAALQNAIATEVKRAYGGRYDQEGTEAAGKHLQVDFEQLVVRAHHMDGTTKSVWFEGSINLDGSITGHSLVAPKDGQPRCSDHTVACGFEQVPAVLRFSARAEASQGNRNVVELWFQQGSWLRAPLFSR